MGLAADFRGVIDDVLGSVAGTSVPWTHVGVSHRDPNTRANVTREVEADPAPVLLPTECKKELAAGVGVMVGDLVLTGSVDAWAYRAPKIGDRCTVHGDDYTVVAIGRRALDEVISYNCQVRRA